MKKRVVALLTVAAMLVSMIAVETVAFADEAEKDVPYVAVSLPPAENAWQANFAEMIDKKMAEAQDEGVLTYSLKSSQDAADQMNVIQTFKDDPELDFLVVLPVDGAQLTATVEEVYDAGIPVIDRKSVV